MTLAALLVAVEHGHFPPADAGLTLVPQPAPRAAAVLGFTAHIVIAADVDLPWIRTLLPPGELSEAFTPPFLGALADKLNRRVNAIDMLMLAPPAAGPVASGLRSVATREDGTSGAPRPAPAEAGAGFTDHPRVRRARRYRDDITVWQADGGVLVLGRGLAGRWEAAVEVDPDRRNRGLGRELARSARHLVPADRPVWAQVTPGNAASIRAFLAAGYSPVGMEALLV